MRLDGVYHCPHHPDGTVAPFNVACACRKPSPGMLLRAAAELRVAPLDCLVIEDSFPGTLSSQNAGMPTLGVPFEQAIQPGPRRLLVPTLEGLTWAAAAALWRELRDA